MHVQQRRGPARAIALAHPYKSEVFCHPDSRDGLPAPLLPKVLRQAGLAHDGVSVEDRLRVELRRLGTVQQPREPLLSGASGGLAGAVLGHRVPLGRAILTASIQPA